MQTLSPQKTKSRRPMPVWFDPPQLGLEIGHHEAKMVVSSERSSGWEVLRAGKWLLTKPLAEAPREITAEIAEWLRREAGEQTGELTATMPSALIDYESVPVSTEEVVGKRAAVTAQRLMRELLGDDATQVSHDFWVTKASQVTTMHLAWTPRDLVTEVAEGLRRCRWRVKSIDLPVAALARLGQFSNRPESQLIVDVSHADANFVWSKFGEPNYLRTRISLGGQPPTAILAERRQISLAAAETSLESWGLKSQEMPSLTELHEACLNDWLDRLSYEIQRTLQFIQAGQPTEARPGVLLCGDAGDIRGIAEWIGQHLHTDVAAVDPGDHAIWTSAQAYRRTYAMALSNSRPGVVE